MPDIIRIMASWALVKPTKALLQRGTKGFWFPRGQGGRITKKNLKRLFASRGIKVRGIMVQGRTNQVRVAISKKDRDAAVQLLDQSGLDWWGG